MGNGDLVREPVSRQLKIFAFDPSLSSQFDMANIGEITISVPWEKDLKPGPVGEYIEVVDADPASGLFYKPVDLNAEWVLAQNGVAPSETNPLFHQQMVYAVAMTTIGHFERALGRVALWSAHRGEGNERRSVRAAVAHLSARAARSQRVLQPGQEGASVRLLPGRDQGRAQHAGHARLHLPVARHHRPRDDARAARRRASTLQRADQSRRARLPRSLRRHRRALPALRLSGRAAQPDRQHARKPGQREPARPARAAIRPGVGPRQRAARRARRRQSEDGEVGGAHARRAGASTARSEPHDRGAILVAAVFGAFLKVYRSRTIDLYRIATEGTGVLREGDIPPDLASRLAEEAARCAQYVLQMCIRAIDYCPPVGITFGDYLRAIITADYDLNPDDFAGYRLAFVESFRQWGLHPAGMRSMSVDSLLWPDRRAAEEAVGLFATQDELHALFVEEQPINFPEQKVSSKVARPQTHRLQAWTLESDRYKTWLGVEVDAATLWSWLMKGKGRKLTKAFGLVVDEDNPPPTVFRSPSSINSVAVEVHSVRRALRRSPRGETVADLVVEITQRRRGYFDPDKQKEMDKPGISHPPHEKGDFRYRAGCTVLMDPTTMEVRRVIRTAGTIADDEQLKRVRKYITEGAAGPSNAFQPARKAIQEREPFALLHRQPES